MLFYIMSNSILFYIVSNDTVSRQWKPWLDCVNTQADLGLHCPQMPYEPFSWGAGGGGGLWGGGGGVHVHLRGLDILGRFSTIFTREITSVTSCSLSCIPIPFQKGLP